jgi:predicted TIM-barrel fold metal-dependent hydrolase
MGFRAAKNRSRGSEAPYPREILNDVFGTADPANAQQLGAELDAALDRLYQLCSLLGAPIMAHAANSNAAFEGSGAHADPYYWRPVFERPNAPSVLLAHFGGFQYRSADPAGSAAKGPNGVLPFDASWEASLARYVESRPDSNVFADVSMFTELFDDSKRAYLLARFRELDARYPAMKSRLIFGTDWHMMATQPRAGEFDGLVRSFVTEVFGAEHLDALMRGNFVRFAGLDISGRSRQRIERFYNGDPVLIDRLRLLDRG